MLELKETPLWSSHLGEQRLGPVGGGRCIHRQVARKGEEVRDLRRWRAGRRSGYDILRRRLLGRCGGRRVYCNLRADRRGLLIQRAIEKRILRTQVAENGGDRSSAAPAPMEAKRHVKEPCDVRVGGRKGRRRQCLSDGGLEDVLAARRVAARGDAVVVPPDDRLGQRVGVDARETSFDHSSETHREESLVSANLLVCTWISMVHAFVGLPQFN